jgi:hypothetical protein
MKATGHMTEPTDRQWEEAERAGMGSFVSLCEDCAALVPNTAACRAAHTDWHKSAGCGCLGLSHQETCPLWVLPS